MPLSKDEIQERIHRFEVARADIGWSMATVGERFAITLALVAAIRSGRRMISDEELGYIEAVCSAVRNIPRPRKMAVKAAAAKPATSPTSVPIIPEYQPMDDTRLMTFDAIADHLAAQYAEIGAAEGMTADERSGALWVIGSLAKRFGVGDETRAKIKAAKAATQAVVEAIQEAPAAQLAVWTVPGTGQRAQRVPMGG